MAHVPDFLKINSEEDATEYLLKVFNTPIIERYGKSAFELDSAAGLNDEPIERLIDDDDDSEEGTLDGSINGLHYVEDHYTGRRFDRLEVLGRDVDKTGKNPYYVCRCDCGNVKSIAVNSLLSGVTKSCGCLKKESDKPNDLTGRKFGKLTVRCLDEERTAQTHKGYWICDCECGGVKSIRADSLTSGKTTSCGCVLAASRVGPKPSMMRDLTGQRFGKLQAIKPDDSITNRSQGIYWICQCDCGNTSSVRSADLVNGKTKSCGHCRNDNLYDLSGEYGIGRTKGGVIFFFDKEDYPKIIQYSWTNDAYGYIVAKYTDAYGNTKSIKMHRLVMGVDDPKVSIDHIHHNLADNRKSELRVVTHSENLQNTKLSEVNTSGHTGVYYNPNNHNWRALIGINGKSIDLGSYPTKEEAIKAREDGEKKYFGEHRYQGTITTEQILNDQKPAQNSSAPANPFDALKRSAVTPPVNLNAANTSGFNGVYYDKLNHNWRARIRINGKLISLGSYPTAEEANIARLEAEKKYFGK